MKSLTRIAAFSLSAAALALLPSIVRALPLGLHLLSPALPAAFLIPTPAPPPAGPPVLGPTFLLSLDSSPLGSQTLDPSLRLTDWGHVFDIAALGAFDIPLRDDPAERTNILLAAQAIDNATVAPGAQFSFNACVGERTPERGYQDGLMFSGGQIVRGTGGGICLVATGLYNAALEAGLDITERHPHSGLVGYAPPGCDAGIVYGLEDLKFRNTTDKPLVIRTQAEDDHLTIQLFGQSPPPDQQIVVRPDVLDTLSPAVITEPDPALLPGQTVIDQTPRSGYDVVVSRFWLDGPRVTRREIVTRERRAPRPEIRRVPVPPVPPTPDLAAPDNTLGPFSPPSVGQEPGTGSAGLLSNGSRCATEDRNGPRQRVFSPGGALCSS